MDKCFICGKEIQRDSIPRIEPKLNKIMLNEDEEEHLVCDACGNLLSIVLKINKNTEEYGCRVLQDSITHLCEELSELSKTYE